MAGVRTLMRESGRSIALIRDEDMIEPEVMSQVNRHAVLGKSFVGTTP